MNHKGSADVCMYLNASRHRRTHYRIQSYLNGSNNVWMGLKRIKVDFTELKRNLMDLKRTHMHLSGFYGDLSETDLKWI